MDAAVAKGDFVMALKERDGLPAPGKAASADWATRAQARVSADALLADPATTAATANR